MAIPKRILDAVAEYHVTYRNPNLPRPEASGIYSLFPEEEPSVYFQHKWPDSWPNSGQPGVYFIFGANMELLYVGKASCLGKRLTAYFRYVAGRGSGCKIMHSWKTRPTFLAAVVMSETFEAASLEEYLIGRLHPEENVLGLTSCIEQPNKDMHAMCEDPRE